MMWNKQNIFEPSGCLSREAFSAFLKNELLADVQAMANEHIVSCPFCSDALEGFKNMVPQKDVTEVMAAADKLFSEKFLSGKKDNRRTIIWIALLTAATIFLLIGLFTVFKNNKTQVPLLADNTVPVKDTAPLSEVPKADKQEPKNLIAQISTKDRVRVNKEFGNPKVPSVHASESEAKSDMIADEQPEIALAKEENQKKEVSSAAGASIATDDSPPAKETQLAMKSVAYNEPEKNDASRMESAPAATSEARRSNIAKSKKSGIIKEEALEQAGVAAKQDTIIFEESATFQGGDTNKYKEYILSLFKYTESLKVSNIKGTLKFQFTVNSNGKVADIKILQSVHPDIDIEIIKILRNSPLWTPGKQNGKPVKQRISMQINF